MGWGRASWKRKKGKEKGKEKEKRGAEAGEQGGDWRGHKKRGRGDGKEAKPHPGSYAAEDLAALAAEAGGEAGAVAAEVAGAVAGAVAEEAAEVAEEAGGEAEEAPAGAGDEPAAKVPRTSRLPKRKMALVVGYCGTGYMGMQMNPRAKTIEAELERAMFRAGGISARNYGFLDKVHFSRAGRTDKGVSAVAQVVALQLEMADNEEGMVRRINEHLPADITVLDCMRVTGSFNARLWCSRRRYQYLIPTWVFSASHVSAVDGETGAPFRMSEAAVGRLNAALANFVGHAWYHNYTSSKTSEDGTCQRQIFSFQASAPFVAEGGVEWIALTVLGQSFLLHQIRKMVATTVDLVRSDRASPEIASVIQQSRNKGGHMVLPLAPGLGLYLDRLFFDDYNRRHVEDFNRQAERQQAKAATETQSSEEAVVDKRRALDWDGNRWSEKLEDFKKQVVWKQILEEETKEAVFAKWIIDLRSHPIQYKLEPEERKKVTTPSGPKALPPTPPTPPPDSNSKETGESETATEAASSE